MPKKGKKQTPPELDFLFARDLLSEGDYRDFWDRWWKADRYEREEIIEEYTDEEEEEEEEEKPKRKTGYIYKNRKSAEKQAQLMGGYVVRRDKSGKFSKTGRHYQAIKRRRK